MPKVKITGYWTFFCNPKYWAIDQFLRDIEPNFISEYRIATWQKKHFSKGQFGIIRVGFDYRTQAELGGKKRLSKGVYAAVEIMDSAFQQKLISEFRINHQKNESVRFVAPIKYITNYIDAPILLSDIENDIIIKEDPYLLKGIQAASMPLFEDTFNRILLYGEENAKVKMPDF